jgi:hypothetical protein
MARVVVTGVSSYTGACIAGVLSARGHEVVGVCRRQPGEYEQLATRRLALARAAGAGLVFGLEATAFPEWAKGQRLDAWIHHHHPMENFRSEAYEVERAQQQVLASIPDLMTVLASRGARLVVYSSTYFEPGEGGQAAGAQVTPYAALKASVYAHIQAACAGLGLTLSRVVIPAPSGALENADRLTPQLLGAARSRREFQLRSPDSIMDVIPGEALAESYAEVVERGLCSSIGLTRRPSGLVTSAADWASAVDLHIARPRGWRLDLKVPPLLERTQPVRFENPAEERVPVDWQAFFSRYAADWDVADVPDRRASD